MNPTTLFFRPDVWKSGALRCRMASSWMDDMKPQLKALLLDAAGTLIHPSEPAAEVYLRYAKKYGVDLSEDQVLQRYREAYATPWGGSTLRYVGDARPFWRFIVAQSTGSKDPRLFEEIYDYYARGGAWRVTPGAVDALERIRCSGLKTGVVSNFDSRLKAIMTDLDLHRLFDAVTVSCDVGAEKPNPIIFEKACGQLGVKPEEAVHVGDDRLKDTYGARDAGCFAWLYGEDVGSFEDIEKRLQTGNFIDSLDDD